MTSSRFWIVMVCGVIGAAPWALAQESKDKPAEKSETKKPTPEEMAEWEKASGPVTEHKKLDGLVGKWNLVIRTPTGEPGKWDESKGQAEYRWIFGGRFLVEEVKCDFQGIPFEWMGIYGYDTHKKQYTGYWVDNFGTDAETGVAPVDPTGKVIDYTGETRDPQSGQVMKFRWTIWMDSPTSVHIDMHTPGPDGTEAKAMEIEMTKA